MTSLPLIGIGVDVHPYADPAEGRELALASLAWPGENGLAGHSDADVAAHADLRRAAVARRAWVTSGQQLRDRGPGLGGGVRAPPCSGRRGAGDARPGSRSATWRSKWSATARGRARAVPRRRRRCRPRSAARPVRASRRRRPTDWD